MPSADSVKSSPGGGAPLCASSAESTPDRRGQQTGIQVMNMNNQLVPYAPPNTIVAPATFDDVRVQCHEAQSIILSLQHAISGQCGLSGAIREEWYENLKRIGQCFITAQAASTHIERVVNGQRTQLENDLQYASMERDLARSEKAAVTQEVDVLRARLRELREEMDAKAGQQTVKRDQSSPAPVRTSDWVQGQNSQQYWGPPTGPKSLTPSRPLLVAPTPNGPPPTSYAGQSPMYSRHDESNAEFQRRLTNLAYGTPSRQQGGQNMGPRAHFAQGQGQRMVSTPARGPSQYPDRRDTIGSGYEPYNSTANIGQSTSASNIAATRPNPQNMSTAMRAGPFASDDTPLRAEEVHWKNLIFKIFDMIIGWAHENCSEPDADRLGDIVTNYGGLWDYICQATYQGEGNAGVGHALHMLRTGDVRPFFIARLLIQYIVQKMWTTLDWEGIRDDVTPTLQYCRQRLADGRIPPQQRYETLQRQARAVNSIMNAPGWHKYEHQKITAHNNRLKDITGPLLSPGTDRRIASGELNRISAAAWEIGAQILSSEYSFQFVFNDCGCKFSFGSHKALNSTEDPMMLQTRQWRVMCVVTPGITYRDDSSVSVTPRFLSKAQVLVMP